MQVKLLRTIKEKTVRPVGSQKEIAVNVRILSATNIDLSKQVKHGVFRQDLFYRINVIELNTPPLRDRIDDLPLLIEYLIKRIPDNLYGDEKIELSDEAINKLKKYHFPGNIRELENILERAVTLCTDNIINADDIHLSETFVTTDDDNSALDSMLDTIEKKKIIEALEKTRWNKTAAAKLLGISFRALRYRLSKLEKKK